MIAVLSDIHGNLEALEAVLADIATFNVHEIYCLGDLIGYGPDPIPCLLRAMEWNVVLQGNFEKASLDFNDPLAFPLNARKSIFRFLDQLAQHPDRFAIREFLLCCPTRLVENNVLYVHGSPRNPLNEYLFPEDIYNQKKMNAIAALFDSLCLCGHTHVPGIFLKNGETWDFKTPAECNHEFPLESNQVICNVGSAGQPRDRNPRACYVLLTPDKIQFRRVPYDVDRTMQKLRREDDDGFSGPRLIEGL